jgi:hypothetical protein
VDAGVLQGDGAVEVKEDRGVSQGDHPRDRTGRPRPTLAKL